MERDGRWNDDLGRKNSITGLTEFLMSQREAVNVKSSRWLNMCIDNEGMLGCSVISAKVWPMSGFEGRF